MTSPEKLLPIELDRIAREVVEVFSDTMPRLMTWDVTRLGRLIENLRMITTLSKEAAHVHSCCPAGTPVDLSKRLVDELTTADGNVDQIREFVGDATTFLSAIDFTQVQTDDTRVSRMLGVLAKLFTEPGEVDLAQLHAELKPNCPY